MKNTCAEVRGWIDTLLLAKKASGGRTAPTTMAMDSLVSMVNNHVYNPANKREVRCARCRKYLADQEEAVLGGDGMDQVLQGRPEHQTNINQTAR